MFQHSFNQSNFQKPAQISSFYLFLIEYILGFWYLFSKIIKYQVHNSLNEYFFFYAFSIIQNCSIGTQFNNSITDSMHKYLFNCFIFCCSLFICVIIFVSNLGRHLCILWFSWSPMINFFHNTDDMKMKEPPVPGSYNELLGVSNKMFLKETVLQTRSISGSALAIATII